MARGIDFLIMVNTGTSEVPAYTKVGGQRGGTINFETDTIDLTSKDSDGWSFEDYGISSWNIEGDGIFTEDDTTHDALINAFMNKESLLVRYKYPSGKAYEGSVIVTEFPIEAPYDDVATYSVTLQGQGAPLKVPAE
ncbi:phage tail tube protein [Exiguobacterium oxidotolerans]|uniref:phage tail tube protein n=1 Tax=Exiguobacterium oxidotolerans TaxID=223958 RepID=UPI00068E14B1|nr:phage major tail protein, TP901-1 family [Exiguobacterium oxidotolerans]